MEQKIIAIVLVIYNKKIGEIPFLELFNNNKTKFKERFKILIYDNSPNTLIDRQKLDINIDYYNDTNNSGLAQAYNWAVEKSSTYNFSWILLLDHDTETPIEFFYRLTEVIRLEQISKEVVALIPIVRANERVISPVYSSILKYHKPINQVGEISGNITGINSGTLVRIKFIKEIGGFNLDFPLDYLDHWFFDSIYKFKKKIYVIDIIINQDLSIDDFDKNINLRRYISILNAKDRYYSKKGILFWFRHNISLIKNCINFSMINKDKDLFSLNLNSLKKNITNVL